MSKYTLKDYNELAYDFAIRNPRVIELLHGALSEEVAKELLTYGIDIEDSFVTSDGEEVTIYTLENLHLQYEHIDFSIQHYGGKKYIVHPDAKRFFYRQEPIEDEIEYINELFTKKGGRLKYIMDRKIFEHYDEYMDSGKKVTNVHNYQNNKKQIKKDIEFVQEWIQPEQYLRLIPGYSNFIKSSLNNYKKSLLQKGNK